MKDKDALVSVVIPTYNVENYIGHCVSSLLRQTYRNIEVIIVSAVWKSAVRCKKQMGASASLKKKMAV